MLRLYLYAQRETAGAASTRRSLRPLFFGRNDLQSPGETRRGKAEVCFMSTDGPHPRSSSPAHAGDPVFQRRQRLNREAAAYWIPRMRGDDGSVVIARSEATNRSRGGMRHAVARHTEPAAVNSSPQLLR